MIRRRQTRDRGASGGSTGEHGGQGIDLNVGLRRPRPRIGHSEDQSALWPEVGSRPKRRAGDRPQIRSPDLEQRRRCATHDGRSGDVGGDPRAAPGFFLDALPPGIDGPCVLLLRASRRRRDQRHPGAGALRTHHANYRPAFTLLCHLDLNRSRYSAAPAAALRSHRLPTTGA